MKLAVRLMLAFVLVAVFAAGITAWLGYRAASAQFERVMGESPGQGALWRSNRADPDDQNLGNQNSGNPNPGSPNPMRGMRGRQVLAELQASSLSASLIALGVALAVGAYLAYRLVQPVRALTVATSRFGRGERDVRVTEAGNDELTDLARTFNRVAEQLATREAQDRRMVADIAHELRTPLTVMKGELEALQDGLLEPTPEAFGRLAEEVDLLERLVRDLRLLSLAEAGQLGLNRGDLDLADLARASLESFAPRAGAKGVRLESSLEPAPVRGDLERLRQVFYNLLENAVQHAPRGGMIRVATAVRGPIVVLEIEDSGPGIPAEHLPRLFDRFYRVDAARSRESGGSGLGLAIVKAIAVAHGGTVEAANRPEGGAVFGLSLPRAV